MSTEDFTEINFTDIISDWVNMVQEWSRVASLYLQVTDTLCAVLQDHFPTPSAFKYNHLIIKRAILEGFPDHDREVIAGAFCYHC